MSFTLDDYKSAFDIAGTSDTADDGMIQLAITAAFQGLEQAYGRQFRLTSNVDKRYRCTFADHLDVVDLVAVHSIAIDVNSNLSYSRALAASDYQLEPFNEPRFQRISITPLAVQGFWPGYMVKVNGDWGYVETWGSPSVAQEPPVVTLAWRILTHRLVRRKDAPFGVLVAPEMGEAVRIAKTDPDVVSLMKGLDRSRGPMAFIA